MIIERLAITTGNTSAQMSKHRDLLTVAKFDCYTRRSAEIPPATIHIKPTKRHQKATLSIFP
jgi:hypothetical protein